MAIKGITTVRNLVSGGVALIAAWSSYSHMVHLVLRYGERPEVAYALPFSVDGMLLVSTIVMADDKRRGHGGRPLARLSFIIGVAASVAANIAAAQPTLGARIIDAWPALALLLVVEMLARPPAAATTPAEHLTPPRPEPHDVPAAPIAPAPSARLEVPTAMQVPAELEVPVAAEHPPVPATPTDPQFDEPSRTRAPVLPSPATVPARHERHLQAVPRSNELPPAADSPANPAAQTGPPAVVPAVRANAVPAEHAATGQPYEPPPEVDDAEPRLNRPEHPTAERAMAQPEPEPKRRVARNATKPRRSATATRALAQNMMRADPNLTKTEIAQRLAISTRRLREVLAS
jgi:hypothetical protein